MAAGSGIINYGEDDSLDTIRKDAHDFYDCIMASARGSKITNCDNVVGSIYSGTGYCAKDKYKGMTYCSCVNSPVANAMCFFAPCANLSYAYKPTNQVRTVQAGKCPKQISCYQINEIGGRHNVTSGNTQEQYCGGIVQTFISKIQASPSLYIVVFVLILSIILLALSRKKQKLKSMAKNVNL